MSMQDAYRRVDQILDTRGSGRTPTPYVLLPALRNGEPVIDFVVPLESPDRVELLTAIREALGAQRGRDRLAHAAAADLEMLSIPYDRRRAA